MHDSRSDAPPGDRDGKTGNESSNLRNRSRIFQAALHKIQHYLRLPWYFLTDTSPLSPELEDKLEQMPETQAQRIRRRWQRSRERATRQQMHKAA